MKLKFVEIQNMLVACFNISVEIKRTKISQVDKNFIFNMSVKSKMSFQRFN